jgi:hypothetical protein
VVAEIPRMVERAEAGELPVNEERAVMCRELSEVLERGERRLDTAIAAEPKLNELPEIASMSER